MHSNGISNGNATNHARPTLDALDSPGIKRRSRHAAKLNMGDTKDDIHVCIMCLRAIMNNKVRRCLRFSSGFLVTKSGEDQHFTLVRFYIVNYPSEVFDYVNIYNASFSLQIFVKLKVVFDLNVCFLCYSVLY